MSTYSKPEIHEVVIPSYDCKLCNSEAFSCYLTMDERQEFMKT
jgi:hypothetical protein